MKTNREIVIEFNTAFDTNNNDDIAKLIAEDFEWHILGDCIIKGKENVLKFFAEHPDMKVITASKDYIIVDGNRASVAGKAKCTDKTGKICDMDYCDVYELAEGLITKMISYTVSKKKAI
jgi:ketosteroid isomerase-like protein